MNNNGSNLIICPVFNEVSTLDEFYVKLRDFYKGQIVFIDDGSFDGSEKYLDRLKDNDSFLIKHEKRRGYGHALISGFNHALKEGFENIITIDADLQHDPSCIPDFFKCLKMHDAVLGSRYLLQFENKNIPKERFTINKYIRELIRQIFFYDFSDPFCGLRGYRSSFLRRISFIDKSYGIALEILLEIVKNKTAYKELPIQAVYMNFEREFLDDLNDPRSRLSYYLNVLSAKRKVLMENEKK